MKSYKKKVFPAAATLQMQDAERETQSKKLIEQEQKIKMTGTVMGATLI